MKTSLTDPLRIAAVSPPGMPGVIGLTLCPGKKDPSGGWNRDLDIDLAVIRKWGAEVIVTLLEPRELEFLDVRELPAVVARYGLRWLHLPIQDVWVPDAQFEALWLTAGRELRQVVRRGGSLLIHCRGGLGRSGMIAARLLVELGMDAQAAIDAVRHARPGAIETRDQELHVRGCRRIIDDPDEVGVPDDPITDRALGCLFGLAVGDAIGTTLEFTARDQWPPLTDMVGGGPFRLKPGEWTDDTSMALCLAESLLACGDLDRLDLMQRFVRWWQDGENSCNGRCFDIGITTRTALSRFLRTGDPEAGSTDPQSAGNGSIMRLAPVVLRWHREPPRGIAAARGQSVTTHAAPAAVEGCALLAEVLLDAVATGNKASILRSRRAWDPAVDTVAQGSWRDKGRDSIRSSGYVVHTLEAALWAVDRSDSFDSAVLLAANLGDDADTVGAVTGQTAGALYGLSGIPPIWRKRLAWGDRIETLGRRLVAASWNS